MRTTNGIGAIEFDSEAEETFGGTGQHRECLRSEPVVGQLTGQNEKSPCKDEVSAWIIEICLGQHDCYWRRQNANR